MRTIRVLLLSCLWLATGLRGRAQTFEAVQLILDIQKLSTLKGILKDLKEGYTVLEKGYSEIRDISKGSFNLHKAFLDALLTVNPMVKEYKRVADIIQLQESLVSGYQTAWARFRQDGHFSPDEVAMIGTIYSRLLDGSVKNLANLLTVLTDGTIRASDAERIKQIDAIYGSMRAQSDFMDRFTNQTEMLSLQRDKDKDDQDEAKSLYGIN
jgi:hypothetical protein